MSLVRVDLGEGARIAVRSLQANRLRAVMTIVGIGIGVATLLSILAIIQGVNASFERQLATMGSNSLYVSKFKWGGSDWWESRNRKDLTISDVQVLREQFAFGKAAAPLANSNVGVSFLSHQLTGVLAIGTNEDYASVSGYELASGRFLGPLDDPDRKSVVVLGAEVADTLFPGADPLGATVRVDGRPFAVIGTLAKRGKALGSNFDRAVVMPYRSLVAYFGKQDPMQIVVAVDRQEHVTEAVDELEGLLRRIRKTPPGQPNDFVINRPEQLVDIYNKLTGALYAVLAGIGLITLLVGGIGIMNVMLMAVRERTREIGVRRALGARRRTIILQFLMEAVVVSAVGGVLGTALGMGLAQLIAAISPLAASVRPLTVAFGISFASALGLLFGIWPAARAANLDPVECLRYE